MRCFYLFPVFSYAQESALSDALEWVIWFLYAALAAFVAWCGFDFFRDKAAETRQARESARAVKLDVAGRKLAVSAKINELKPIARAVANDLNEPDTAEIEESFAFIETEYETAAENFDSTADLVGKSERKRRMADLYEAEEEYLMEKVLPHLEKAQRWATALEKRLKELRELIQNPQKRIDEANWFANSVEATIRAAHDGGYKIEQIKKDHAAVRDMIAKAVTFRQDKAYLRMEEACKQAIDAVIVIEKTVNDLPMREALLKIDIQTRSYRADQIEVRIRQGRLIFDRMRSEYSEEQLAPISGNSTEAEKLLIFARDSIREAEVAVSRAVQDWDKAQNLLDGCENALNEAVLLIGSINNLDRNLSKTKSEIAQKIENAQNATRN